LTLDEKIINYKVIDHIDKFNFCIVQFIIRARSKFLNFEFQNLSSNRNFDN
jgi:hypothetical protein